MQLKLEGQPARDEATLLKSDAPPPGRDLDSILAEDGEEGLEKALSALLVRRESEERWPRGLGQLVREEQVGAPKRVERGRDLANGRAGVSQLCVCLWVAGTLRAVVLPHGHAARPFSLWPR